MILCNHAVLVKEYWLIWSIELDIYPFGRDIESFRLQNSALFNLYSSYREKENTLHGHKF